jgi:DNA-binding GntR family transcriptional regulator
MRHRGEFFVPTIVLDRASEIPLRRQIYAQLAQSIQGGAMRHRTRLPSTRLMAKLLRVSRNTVLAAYDDLAADDLVRGERGSGMRVNKTPQVPELSMFGLKRAIREAGYPARIVSLTDLDGNPLYINY